MSNSLENDLHASEIQQIVAADTGVFEKSALEPSAEEAQPQTQAKAQDDNVPMDGGTQAWLQVVASFLLYFNHLYALPRIN
jgi:hypothetical protein